MTLFRYRAYNTSGKSVSGSIEADAKKAAVEEIKNSGLYPTAVKSVVSNGTFFSRLKPVSAETLALSTRQFSTLLASGSTMTEALLVLQQNCTDSRLSAVLLKVKEDIVAGTKLSSAMALHPEVFSPFYCGLIASGEVTGTMDNVLLELAEYLETRAHTLRELKTALAYPALMLIVGAVVLGFLFVFVVPKITRIFEQSHATLPFITTVLIFITDTVIQYWPLLVIAAVISAAALFRLKESSALKPYIDSLILKTPWLGHLALSFHISTMTRTLGSLLSGGVPLLGALAVTKGVVSNTVFKSVIEHAAIACAEGATLSKSLMKESSIPTMVTHMIGVGEKSGNLGALLLTTAKTYEGQFSAGLKKTISLIEPLMILTMGLVVGIIVLAILLPIFELNQIIR